MQIVATPAKPTLAELDAAADNLINFPAGPDLLPTASEFVSALMHSVWDHINPQEYIPTLFL